MPNQVGSRSGRGDGQDGVLIDPCSMDRVRKEKMRPSWAREGVGERRSEDKESRGRKSNGRRENGGRGDPGGSSGAAGACDGESVCD